MSNCCTVEINNLLPITCLVLQGNGDGGNTEGTGGISGPGRNVSYYYSKKVILPNVCMFVCTGHWMYP